VELEVVPLGVWLVVGLVPRHEGERKREREREREERGEVRSDEKARRKMVFLTV
jgi:hypothetical protein